MDEKTFVDATVQLLESGNDVRLRQFIRTLKRPAPAGMSLQDYERTLDRWAIFCAQAWYFDRPDLVEEAISAVCDA